MGKSDKQKITVSDNGMQDCKTCRQKLRGRTTGFCPASCNRIDLGCKSTKVVYTDWFLLLFTV